MQPPMKFVSPDQLKQVSRPAETGLLTVVETCYHFVTNEQDSTPSDSRFALFLKSSAPAYRRPSLKVGQTQVPLDTGYVDDPGTIIITNVATEFATVPTKQQRDEADAKVVEVSAMSHPPFSLIPPGASLRLHPPRGVKYQLRCRQGMSEVPVETEARIIAIPR